MFQSSRMKTRMNRLAIFVFYLLYLKSHECVGLPDLRETCDDVVLNCRLEFTTKKLVIDDFIEKYHSYKRWQVTELATQAYVEYTIDLTCLEYLNKIENVKEVGEVIELVQFSTHSTVNLPEKDQAISSCYLRVEYVTKQFKSTVFIANIFIKNPNNIHALVLKYNRLLENIPSQAFILFENLAFLDLAWNNIAPTSSFRSFLEPSSFEGLSKLTHLDLTGNPLVLQNQPYIFYYLKQLVSLNLSSSFVASNLEDGIFNGLENLQVLNLSTCGEEYVRRELKANSRVFENLEKLRTLDFSCKIFTLTDLNDRFRPDILPFSFLENLPELILMDFYYTFDGNPIPAIICEFFPSNNLVSLDTSFLSDQISAELENFVCLESMKKLGVRNHKLISEKISKTIFANNVQLLELDLSFNKLDQHIFEALAFVNSSVETLNLNNNKIELLDIPVEISILSQLKKLYLKRNLPMSLNVSHFLRLGRLRVLDISQNSIKFLTVRSFQGLESLENLNLENNIIRTIENGTFLPLVKLLHIDLRKNQIKNLYLYGLAHNCAIYHDGLSMFNMSFIDLSQMERGRDKSFLYKTLHLRNSRRLLVYRNVIVDPRSVSHQSNCSLYFHVLRKYRFISFEIDEAYLLKCSSEHLQVFSFTFHQEEFSEIQKLTSPRAYLRIPTGFTYLVATTDGFLIGLSNHTTRTEIVILRLDKNKDFYTFKIDQKADKLVLVSDNFLISYREGDNFRCLWNISEKPNISLLVTLAPSFTGNEIFLVNDTYLTVFDQAIDSLCFFHLFTYQLNCMKFQDYNLGKSYLRKNFIVLNKVLLVFKFSFDEFHVCDLTEIREEIRCNITTLDEKIGFIMKTPNDLYVIDAFTDMIKVWTLQNQTLNLKHLEDNIKSERIVVIQSAFTNETLVVSAWKQVVSLWSVRYEKLLERIEFYEPPKLLLASFNQGLVIIDNSVYQF